MACETLLSGGIKNDPIRPLQLKPAGPLSILIHNRWVNAPKEQTGGYPPINVHTDQRATLQRVSHTARVSGGGWGVGGVSGGYRYVGLDLIV